MVQALVTSLHKFVLRSADVESITSAKDYYEIYC